jgi:hypothetical protein
MASGAKARSAECIVQTRLLLPEQLLEAYKEGVHTALAGVKIGDPADAMLTWDR